MKHLLFIAVLTAACCLHLTGCKSHHGAYAPKDASRYDLENEAKAVLLDPALRESVTYSQLQETRLADGRLRVGANVLNLENRRLEVEINCVFKDAQGFPVEEMPFRTLILTENAQEGVQFVSMNKQAQRYTIRIRQAR